MELITKIWGLQLDHPEQSVLVSMADHANDDGLGCFPSLPLIAWKTGYSVRQTRRIIKRLISVKLLVPLQFVSGGRNRPTEYFIDVTKGIKKPPFIRPKDLNPADRQALIIKHRQTCQYCGKSGDDFNGPDGKVWNVDRVIPESKGGQYIEGNMVLSCGTCNRSKGAKMAPFERVPSETKRVPSETKRVPSETQKGATTMAPESFNLLTKEKEKEKREAPASPKPVKKPYGELQNVLLTDQEHEKLIERFGGAVVQDKIAALDLAIASKGLKYQSHYATLLNWDRMDRDKQKQKPLVEAF
jgi:5-methylcytosine-specific restriction endonuclease McrA